MTTKKSNAGRPEKYKAEYDDMARVACAEMGADLAKLGRLFAVSRTTIKTWMHEHESFKAAVNEGRDEWDTDQVERAVFKRATGFRYTETRVETEAGEPVKTVKTRKYVPAEPTCATFWLRNRRRSRWPDKQAVALEGGETPVEFELPGAITSLLTEVLTSIAAKR